MGDRRPSFVGRAGGFGRPDSAIARNIKTMRVVVVAVRRASSQSLFGRDLRRLIVGNTIDPVNGYVMSVPNSLMSVNA